MLRRIVVTAAALTLFVAGNRQAPQASGPEPSMPGLPDVSTLDELAAEDCVDGSIAQGQTFREGGVADDKWPPGAVGGIMPPIRSVYDPFPTFDGMALDLENNRVVISDENRHSLLVYDRTAGSFSDDITEPAQWVFGPKTKMGYIAGVEIDPSRKEFYTINNDGGDRMVVFSYGDHGNVEPKRILLVPHQSWDLSLAPKRDEIAISVQMSNAISIFSRGAKGTDKPLRTIRGLATELEDPHGIYFDEQHNEIVTANHGNWTQIRPYTPYDPLVTDMGEYKPGHFHAAAIVFHPAAGNGDVAPVRKIEGPLTGLNWPMGLDVDLPHDEIAVANYGDSSVRVFRRTDRGDASPVRTIRGPQTQIVGPVSVVVDPRNDELWVANYGDHTAVVFARTATGNAKPKRIIRNAPVNAPTCGFTNASAAAYDSKRDQLLVPN